MMFEIALDLEPCTVIVRSIVAFFFGGSFGQEFILPDKELLCSLLIVEYQASYS